MKSSNNQKILLFLVFIVICVFIWKAYCLLYANEFVDENLAVTQLAHPAIVGIPYVSSENAPKNNADLLIMETKSQYVKLISQYQQLKAQQHLLATKVAAVLAKRKYKAVGKPSFIADNNQEFDTITNTHNLNVIYIDKIAGKWNATINYNGIFYEVYVGSVLPGNMKIYDIDSDNIFIKQDNKFFKLSLNNFAPIETVDEAIE